MVPLTSLWLPILLSAILVFAASFVLHMVLPLHRSDIRKLPAGKEEEVLDALRRAGLPPGDYGAPHPGSPAGMKEPTFVARMEKGPVAFMTIAPGRAPGMGAQLAQWFAYTVVVGVFAAYVAGISLPPGTEYGTVFRLVATVTLIGYALALPQQSIWYMRSWGATLRSMLDGLVYGLLAGGVFGWLWPR